ncbi:RNA-binding protein, putative [Bodo saltans]|uniref:RNA-binding protein, putative n=1 Tax=Bodo saltans TaxID=75058 RepID=A0A0S4IZ08_BODSA|nr:RNA-binding protein, putative [Bodo saltans]|eukprot:CUG24941.1 RNA-binding protein, putative [Bodo saltans]
MFSPTPTQIRTQPHTYSSLFLTMAAQNVVEALEKLFSPKYLYDPAHSLLRVIVSPPTTDNESGAADVVPPLIPLKNLLLHAEISTAVASALLSSTNGDDESARLNVLSDAAAKAGSVVLVAGGEQQQPMIRRRAFLLSSEDPALRSVFVRPIHPEASTGEVISFFSHFGAIEEVTQRGENQKGSGSVLSASAVLVFETEDGARACVDASTSKKLSYGTLPTPLAQRFVPKLTAKLLNDHLESVAEQSRVAEQKQLHANIIEARKELATTTSSSSTSGGGAATSSTSNPFEVKRYLPAGRTLKCMNLPENVSWQEIKAHFGNLSLSQPVLKGAMTLVKIVDASSTTSSSVFKTRTALLVFKSAAAVEHLVATYSLATMEYMDKIRALCPTLAHLTAEEETWVRAQYPAWTEVGKGGGNNRKRGRD